MATSLAQGTHRSSALHACPLCAVAADAIEASTSRVASELQQGGQRSGGPRVGIIMGSDSDLATMKVGRGGGKGGCAM